VGWGVGARGPVASAPAAEGRRPRGGVVGSVAGRVVGVSVASVLVSDFNARPVGVNLVRFLFAKFRRAPVRA